jgi:hypothetical protein
VLTETHQQKLLTVSDLNRLPVRTYLHTLLDHLESVMAAAIGEAYPYDRWFALLSESRQAKVSELHELKQRSDFDTCLIDCTTLSDKATILARSEGLRPRAAAARHLPVGHHRRMIRASASGRRRPPDGPGRRRVASMPSAGRPPATYPRRAWAVQLPEAARRP